MPSKLLSTIPVIPSLNVEQSLEFYQRHLGFSAPFTWGQPADYGGVSYEGIMLHFFLYPNRSFAENYTLRLEVDEVDLLYVACQAAGIVHPNGKLENKPWGHREFSVLDPSGVCLRLFQAVG